MEKRNENPSTTTTLDEVAASSPAKDPDEQQTSSDQSLEDTRNPSSYSGPPVAHRLDTVDGRKKLARQHSNGYGEDANLGVIEAPAPVQQDVDIPKAHSQGAAEYPLTPSQSSTERTVKDVLAGREDVSRVATQLYAVSYLIFFSILGTLARLGLQALTTYPNAPVQEGVLWANFAGSLFMGFLGEDHTLFAEGGGPAHDAEGQERKPRKSDEEHDRSAGGGLSEVDRVTAKRRHNAMKKTIPLYIGLATGFCGSLTSFSSFMRDVFLALSNDLPVPRSHTKAGPIISSGPVPRNGGYSFMALIAVILITVCLCLSALQCGAHLAIALEAITPALGVEYRRRILDRAAVVLGWGTWLSAVFIAIWPPDRPGGPSGRSNWSQETWRGEAVFALVFAPLGCLVRFYASTYLNGRILSFPLGTFVVNISGTVILGMCYDLQHVRLGSSSLRMVGGSRVGCQVLQGVMDGFCGCLTTVSTWVVELKTLKKRHAYIYGSVSVGLGLAFLVVIMGSLRWTVGFSSPACTI
ncbi:hypothetical protein MMC16_007906 [Acarospora aff. strigata]|nr:hypothetical protein [Acarospora aff. strigata]